MTQEDSREETPHRGTMLNKKKFTRLRLVALAGCVYIAAIVQGEAIPTSPTDAVQTPPPVAETSSQRTEAPLEFRGLLIDDDGEYQRRRFALPLGKSRAHRKEPIRHRMVIGEETPTAGEGSPALRGERYGVRPWGLGLTRAADQLTCRSWPGRCVWNPKTGCIMS
jgi:hypothetical protein